MPRRRKTAPNPIFVKLMEELRDEALAENNMPQYFNYCKATKTLKNYPFGIDVETCANLPYFGHFTARKFKEKLQAYYDTMMYDGCDLSKLHINSPSACVMNRNSPKKPSPTQSGAARNTPRRTNQKKPYVPRVGTGAYAILITMLREKESPNFRGFTVKNEIIEKGYGLSNASMTQSTSRDPRRSYTAFHGMKTLQEHELVFTINSRPIKYKLSDKGVELARKLLQQRENREKKARRQHSNCSTPRSSADKNRAPFPSSSRGRRLNSTLQNYDSFDYYEDFDEESCFPDFLAIDDVPEPGPSGLQSTPSSSFISPSKSTNAGNSNDDTFSDYSYEDFDRFCVINKAADSSTSSQVVSLSDEDSSKELSNFFSDEDFIVDIPTAMPSTTETINQPESTSTLHSIKDFEQLTFVPGSFEIELVIDIMETQGGSSKYIPEIIQQMSSSGTNFSVRRLELGDFLWVARHKESGKELVLPYIIERKRMDDLVESFRDGRYHEQKFRLRRCGLPNVIYLVEKFGKDDGMFGIPVATLRQAVVNTQVVDNFFIKTTNYHRQTISYLSNLTKLLTDVFMFKTLFNCTREDAPPHFDTEEDLAFLMTYEEFSSHSKKNLKNLKIQELFMKQLLQIKDMSVQKASVIVENYQTPRALKQALLCCSQPETMISNLTFDNTPPIGPSLSRSVWQLYTDRKLF